MRHAMPLGEQTDDALDVVTPATGLLLRLIRQLERHALINIQRTSINCVVVSQGRDRDAISIECERHHKPVIVIRVLADEIYTTGRTKGSRTCARELLELFNDRLYAAHVTGSTSARSSGAFCSGSVSLMKKPAPASLPARYFSLLAVRIGG